MLVYGRTELVSVRGAQRPRASLGSAMFAADDEPAPRSRLTCHEADPSRRRRPQSDPAGLGRKSGAYRPRHSRSADQQTSILVLPELCICGYGCEDAFHSRGVQEVALDLLLELAEQTRGIAVSVGLPLRYAGGLFNAACLLADGRIAGFVPKQHLAGDGIHYEPRWFKRWPEGVNASIDIRGEMVPIGDLLFDLGSVRIGFEICEDAWVGSRPGSSLAARGADVLLNPSASHFAFGKHQIRRRFVMEGSRAFYVTYCYANLVGNEAGRAIYDGDAMIAHGGRLVAVGPRFSFDEVHLTSAVVDVDASRMSRAQSGSFEPDVDGDESDVVPVPFEFPALELQANRIDEAAWERGESVKEEEFTRAVALGLFDYLRKSRSRGVVISLSGGADQRGRRRPRRADAAMGGTRTRLPASPPAAGVRPPLGPAGPRGIGPSDNHHRLPKNTQQLRRHRGRRPRRRGRRRQPTSDLRRLDAGGRVHRNGVDRTPTATHLGPG